MRESDSLECEAVADKMRESTSTAVPRDFQDRLEFDDLKLFNCALRSTIHAPLKANIAPLLRCHFLGVMFHECYKCEDGWTLRSLAPHYTLGEHFDLTSARFTLQSSKFAFPRPSSVPTYSARQNQVLVRLPFSCSQLSNKWNQSLAKHPFSLCATLVSLHTRSRTNTHVSANICQMSRLQSSTVELPFRRMPRFSRTRRHTHTSLSPHQVV